VSVQKSSTMLRKITESRLFFPFVALAFILLFDLIIVPGFFRIYTREGNLYGNLIDILRNGSTVSLLAIGMTLVIATRGVDLSVGAVMAIAASVAAILMNPYVLARELPPHIVKFMTDPNFTYQPLWVVILAALAVSAICGAWNGLLVAYGKIQPMIATLILMIAGRGIAQLITNGVRIDLLRTICLHRPGMDHPALFPVSRGHRVRSRLAIDPQDIHRHVHRIGGHQLALQLLQRH